MRRALSRCAEARGGRVAPNLAHRCAAVSWMAHDLDAGLLGARSELLEATFVADGDHLRLRTGAGDEELKRRVCAAAIEAVPCSWPELYETAARAVAGLGLPDPAEVRALTAEVVEVRGRRCVAR